MSLADQWSKMLVYIGIAEENEEWYDDEDGHTAEESLEQARSGRNARGTHRSGHDGSR